MAKPLTLKQLRRCATAYAKVHWNAVPHKIASGYAFDDGSFRKNLRVPAAVQIGQGYNLKMRQAIADYARHERRMK